MKLLDSVAIKQLWSSQSQRVLPFGILSRVWEHRANERMAAFLQVLAHDDSVLSLAVGNVLLLEPFGEIEILDCCWADRGEDDPDAEYSPVSPHCRLLVKAPSQLSLPHLSFFSRPLDSFSCHHVELESLMDMIRTQSSVLTAIENFGFSRRNAMPFQAPQAVLLSGQSGVGKRSLAV
ncbi:hypothetical protein HDV03_004030 [Kappamyces sp. JEL0829]|nr:hypothetical protein HDV03_004030 [Kappamyces sp. JEL0829]